jgi:hypothetical protein
MKFYKLHIALLLILFGISNSYANPAKCKEGSGGIFTKYSDDNQAYLNGIREPKPFLEQLETFSERDRIVCKCTVTFTLETGEEYLGLRSRSKLKNYIVISSKESDVAWAKTANQISLIVEQHSRCPNEDEYQATIKNAYLEEKRVYKKVVEDERRDEKKKSDLFEQEISARLNLVKKFCKGIPKVNIVVIENVSSVAKVDPQTIRLNRVNIADDGYCYATFYTPKGVVRAFVILNENGVITSNSNIYFNR